MIHREMKMYDVGKELTITHAAHLFLQVWVPGLDVVNFQDAFKKLKEVSALIYWICVAVVG